MSINFLSPRAHIVCSAFLAFAFGFSVPTYAQTCTASFGFKHIVQVEVMGLKRFAMPSPGRSRHCQRSFAAR